MAEIRDARLITKRTSVPGKIPTGTTGNELNFIKSGELASNLSDHSLWGFDGANVFEYGSSSFLGLTGGTISGNVFVSIGLSATTLSGGTIYSGGTNLYDIFLTAGDLSGITVSAGSNISVQQVGNDYKVSLTASPSVNNLTFSGTSTGGNIFATNLSGGTIFSGGTNLYDIFEPKNKSPYETYILTAGTSYSFTGTVNTVSIYKTIGSATHINLPSSPVVNNFYVVKDRKGDSTFNPITVSGGTYTIDGSTSIEIRKSNKPSFTFLFDGSEYIII